MPTQEEIAAARSPEGNLSREAEVKSQMGFRDRAMSRLQGEGPAPAPEGDVAGERQAPRESMDDGYDRAGRDEPRDRREPPEEEDQAALDGAGDREVDDTGDDEGYDESAGDGAEDGEDAGDGTQLTPRKLAEMAGVTPDQLYGMEVRFGDGPDEVFTLEEVKDRYRDLARVDGMRQELDSEAIENTRTMATTIQELGDRLGEAQANAEFFYSLAEQGVRQFEGIDWAALRAEPEKYEATRRRYESALRNRDQVAHRLQNIQQARQTEVDSAKRKQAQVSLSILKRTIPDWGPERFQAVREFAAEQLHYDPAEVDQITDWRHMRLLNQAYELSRGRDRVQNVRKRDRGGQKPGARRSQTARPRNAQGQFQSSKAKAFDRPGDKSAFREMKRRQLATER